MVVGRVQALGAVLRAEEVRLFSSTAINKPIIMCVCSRYRQENMGMQAKYGALEIKSKELLAQQGNAVSGASVALNSLGSRLEQLVEQLIASYNISEQELEVSKEVETDIGQDKSLVTDKLFRIL